MLQERFIHSGKLENRNVNWSLVLLLQFLQLLKINTKNDDSSISSFCSDLLGYLRMHLTIPGRRERPDLTGDVPIWRPGEVSRRLIRVVSRTFSGRPLHDLENTSQRRCEVICCMSLNFFLLFFRNLFDWPSLSKSNSILKVYLEPSRTSNTSNFVRELNSRNSTGF